MRSLSISWMRMIAMLMVVLYHCLCPYTSIWGNITGHIRLYGYLAVFMNTLDMPIFVFLSGLLYERYLEAGKYNKTVLFIKNKTKRLIIPFIFWGTFSIVFLGYEVSRIHIGIGHLWFLLMLFCIFTVSHLTKKVWSGLNYHQSLLFFGVLVVASLFSHFIEDTNLFVLKQIIKLFYSFYLGVITEKFKLEKKLSRRGILISLIYILVSIWRCYILIYLLPIAISCFTLGIYHELSNIEFQQNSILNVFDKSSMGIYIVHHIILKMIVASSLMVSFMSQNIWAPFILFPIVLITSLGASFLIGKTSYLKCVIG